MQHAPSLPDDLIARLDVPGPRYTSYPPAPVWRDSFAPDHLRERLETAGAQADAPLSLYVHIPFCENRCTFCGCNVVVGRDLARTDEYLADLERELAIVAACLGARRRLGQIHWGGGTPTFLDPPRLERLWAAIVERFRPDPDAEIAVEIDPAVTTSEHLECLARLGFNRLSMGVQDFDPDVQRAVDRVQGVDETRTLVEVARALGFRGINFDLIYGLPLQTEASWRRTLDQVLALAPDRAAVYGFAFVPQARPHQRRLSVLDRPQGRSRVELFLAAHRAFTGAGYLAIGMDHFARPGDELALAQAAGCLTRNFQGYSARAAADTIAVGVTAISDCAGAYAQNVAALPRYHAALAAGRLPVERGWQLSADDLTRRSVIRALMCNFRVDLAEHAGAFEEARSALREHERGGLVEITGTRVEVTPLGRLFVRNLAMAFDAYLGAASGPTYSRTV